MTIQWRIISSDEFEELCELSHDEYEQAAAMTGWETQERSRVPWSDVPESNKDCVRDSLRAVLSRLDIKIHAD